MPANAHDDRLYTGEGGRDGMGQEDASLASGDAPSLAATDDRHRDGKEAAPRLVDGEGASGGTGDPGRGRTIPRRRHAD